MNKITDIVMEVEKLKANQKFNQAIEILEKSIVEYNDDYIFY